MGLALLLQISLPRRNLGRRYSPDDCGPGAAAAGRYAVQLEDAGAGPDLRGVDVDSPSVLPVPLSSGGFLFPV